MAIHDLKGQIGRLPEQPGVYLFLGAAGETLYVGKARVLRDRVRCYLGAGGTSPRHRRAPARRGRARRHRHRLGRRGAGAREPPDQAAQPALQRPAARRQDVSVPAADDDRARAAAARGPPGRARRQRLRRAVHAGVGRAADDGAGAPAVRHPVVQRGHRRPARPAVPRVRHQALPGAVRRRRSARSSATAARSSRRGCCIEGRQDELVERPARRDGARPPADERFERAAHLRDAIADGRDAARPAQQDGDAVAGRSRRVRPQGRAGGRASSRCSRCGAAASSIASSS